MSNFQEPNMTPQPDGSVSVSTRALHKWTCNQVRKKITNLIQSGEMKVTHFQKEIGVYSSDYGRFMKMTAPMQGEYNVTYMAAHEFFRKREWAGNKARPRKSTAADLDKFNVDGIEFEDEGDLDVPVYGTCDDVRTKIRAHLKEPGMTQAAFCREIAKTYRGSSEPNKTIQSVQIQNFLKQSGARSGNMSAVYYAAYVYFEKLRIKNGAKRSKKRLQIEHIHWEGMDRKTNWANQHYIGSAYTTLHMDDLGLMFSMPIMDDSD